MHDRQCTHCDVKWPEAGLEAFVKDPGSRHGRRNWCRLCWNKRRGTTWRQHAEQLRRWFGGMLRFGPCEDCGWWPDDACQMDLDHVWGEKDREISRMVHRRESLSAITFEASKCELVCARCHRLRTKQRRLGTVAQSVECRPVTAEAAGS